MIPEDRLGQVDGAEGCPVVARRAARGLRVPDPTPLEGPRDELRVGRLLVGIDRHKGRPGASYPGASQFGAYGGIKITICYPSKGTCALIEYVSTYKAFWLPTKLSLIQSKHPPPKKVKILT